jgi:hypothetical protein
MTEIRMQRYNMLFLRLKKSEALDSGIVKKYSLFSTGFDKISSINAQFKKVLSLYRFLIFLFLIIYCRRGPPNPQDVSLANLRDNHLHILTLGCSERPGIRAGMKHAE